MRKDPFIARRIARRSARRRLSAAKRYGPLHRTPYWYVRYLSHSWQHSYLQELRARRIRGIIGLISLITLIIILIVLTYVH